MTSISLRVTLAFAAVVTATTAALLVLGGWMLSRQMIRGISFLNEAEFVELRDRLGPQPGALTPAEIKQRIGDHLIIDASLYYCQVHDDRGEILFRSANLGDDKLPIAGPTLGAQHRTLTVEGLGPLQLSEFSAGPLHLQIASSLEATYRLMRDYYRVSGVLLICAAAASLGIGYGFARFTLRPVRLITDTARRINAANLSERIPDAGRSDEISRLARLLNEMFDRLESSFRQVQRFTADASHELKTPLSLIQLNAEKLRSQVGGDAVATAAVEDLLVEIDRLHQIIETLLFISKAEGGVLPLERKFEQADRFIDSFAEDARVLAEDSGVRFAVERNDTVETRVEPNLVRQLLLNLVTNAVAVSPRGGCISLSSAVENGHWIVNLRDEGPGLPPDQLERVFERFVRLERPGSSTRRGHGLGLAICRIIAELHGGRIYAENRADRSGLIVTMDLPAN